MALTWHMPFETAPLRFTSLLSNACWWVAIWVNHESIIPERGITLRTCLQIFPIPREQKETKSDVQSKGNTTTMIQKGRRTKEKDVSGR